ncbi:MAG: hypothetical protein HYU66_23905 [Armatimonadetes bacterium]|nr:hypothetical protein [Armatimonadota bacterium]
MDDAEFDRTLNAYFAAQCLPLTRFAPALYREDWTMAEEKHLETCRRCRRMRQAVAKELWYPSLWQLVRYVRSSLREEEREDVTLHVEEVHGAWATRVVGVLRALLPQAQPMRLVPSLAVHRASYELSSWPIQTSSIQRALAESGSAGQPAQIQVDPLPDSDRIALRLLGAAPELAGHLVAVRLANDAGDELAVLMLMRGDRQHGSAGVTSFGPRQLPASDRPDGALEVEVLPIDEALPAGVDEAALQAAIAVCLPDEALRRAWLEWAAGMRTCALDPRAAAFLDGLEEALGGPG